MLAKDCGYEKIGTAETQEQLKQILIEAKNTAQLAFVEVKCANGTRNDLGRPTTIPWQNKQSFMELLINDKQAVLAVSTLDGK